MGPSADSVSSRRNGQYVTKKFGLRKLAREIEFLDPALTIVLGKGPDAAAGRLPSTVVVDTRSSEEDGERETYALLLVLVSVGGSFLVDDLFYSAFSG